jgi:hypothetical protein
MKKDSYINIISPEILDQVSRSSDDTDLDGLLNTIDPEAEGSDESKELFALLNGLDEEKIEDTTTDQEVIQDKNKIDFFENLAIILGDDLCLQMGTDLLSKFDKDKQARSKRDEQYEEGLRKTGFTGLEGVGGADFAGASRVQSPMIAQACVEFQSRSIKEMFPANGPVKSFITGAATTKKISNAQQKTEFLNYLLINEMPYRVTLEKMLSQLPLGGSQFIKFWYDTSLKRPNCEFIPIDNVYIPYICNDFYKAERVSIMMPLTDVEYTSKIKQKIYYDPEPDAEGSFEQIDQEDTNTYSPKSVNNIIEGISASDIEDDDPVRTRLLIEMYAYICLPEDIITEGEYAPYIVTINYNTKKIISVYRNWHPKDKLRKKLDYMVMFDFIPWRGAYGIGLFQLIGQLSIASTGALRALLDSALINTLPTAVGTKGIKMAGQTTSLDVGTITLLEGTAGLDTDVRKMIMPLPFNPPSGVLFDLLQFLEQQAAQVVKTPDGVLGNVGNDTPANSVLAAIEQQSATQSAVHARLHYAQAKCLDIICRLLRDNFDAEGFDPWILEDLQVNRELFEHSRDIKPVSDPNIFTESQRFAQLNAIMQLASQQPQYFNMGELCKRQLELIKIPNPEMLLNLPPQATRSNQVSENMAILLGGTVQVYPEQNHLAHLKVLLEFMANPVYGGNPLFADKFMPLAQHASSHLAYLYAQTFQAKLRENPSLSTLNVTSDLEDKKIDLYLASINQEVLTFIQQELQPFQQIIQPLLQQFQQAQQGAPDPNMIKAQADMSNVQREVQRDQMEHQYKMTELQVEQQKIQAEAQRSALDLQIEKLKSVAQLHATSESAQNEQLRILKDYVMHLDKMSIEHKTHHKEQHNHMMDVAKDIYLNNKNNNQQLPQ